MNELSEIDQPLSRVEHGSISVSPVQKQDPTLSSIWTEHRVLFLCVFVSVLACGAVYIFGSHKKYQSKMEILVQNSISEAGITAGRSEAPASVHEIQENELYSELEMLQSADVLDEAVDRGWSEIPFAKRATSDLNQHNEKVGLLRNSLYVVPLRKSYILDVELTARDPYDANRKLTSILNAYMSEKRKISHPSGASTLFTQEADSYKQQWMAAEAEFARFQQEHHLVSIKDEEGSLEKQVQDLDTERREAEVTTIEFQHKLDGDRSELARIPTRHATRETSIPATGSIDSMHSRLSELTLERTELLMKYKADDRLVRAVDAKIHDIQTALSDSQGLHSAETTSDINPTYQFLEQDLSDVTSRLAAVRGRRAAIEGQLADLQGRLSHSEQAEQSYDSLANRVSELQGDYELYAQKRDQAALSEAMDQHQLLNVVVVETPTLSLSAIRPRPLTDGVLTALTALFLASAAVFFAYNRRANAAPPRVLGATVKYSQLQDRKIQRQVKRAHDRI